MNISKYIDIENDFDLNYLCSLRDDKAYNMHVLKDDHIVVMRNYTDDGSLVDLRQKFNGKRPWVMLKMKQFIDKDSELKFDVPVCVSCSSELDSLEKTQKITLIASRLCSHSKIISYIIKDYQAPIEVDDWLTLSEDRDESNCKVEIIHKKLDTSTRSQHLAVVFLKDKPPSLLWTQGRLINPKCSSCEHPKCHCIRYFLKRITPEENIPHSSNDHENEDNDMDDKPKAHYMDREYGESGYNTKPITIPLNSCPIQASVIENQNSYFNLPSELYPQFDESFKCKHGNYFIEDLYKCVSTTSIVYHERGETVTNTRVYARTNRQCKCEYQFDSSSYLLFHVGKGRFWDYYTLQKFLFCYCRDGLSADAFYESIAKNFNASQNQIFSCDIETFRKAANGFVANIAWNYSKVFSCPNCKLSPKYFTGDGKCDIAPLQRKLTAINLKEISKHPDDKTILAQSTCHKQRIFLKEKSERDCITSLLTENISLEQFLAIDSSKKSEQFQLLYNIVKRFQNKEKLPESYVKLMAECSKNISVAGILQVNNRNVLKTLRLFCLKQLNIRTIDNSKYLNELRRELPAIWPILLDILNYEDSTYLPKTVSLVVLMLLKIRIDTFKNSTQRYSNDYFKYDKPHDEATQFYPMFPLLFYPKLYRVNATVDKDG